MPKTRHISRWNAPTTAQETLAQDISEHLSGKWVFWILHVLEQAAQPLRFARILEAVDGISQKVLTRILRQLEADGFVSRTIYAEVPPRVEYELTDLGRGLLAHIAPLRAWVLQNIDAFAAARAKFGNRAE